MSELYLDVEHDDSLLKRVAHRLAETQHTVEGLERILFAEVHPVCCWNMRLPAGEWITFDKQWLVSRIEEELARPPASGWIKRLAEKRRRREIAELEDWIRPEWERVASLIQELRPENGMAHL